MWNRLFGLPAGSWRRRRSTRYPSLVRRVIGLVVVLCAVNGCASSVASGGGVTGTFRAVPDTASCPRGHGGGIADLPDAALACLTARGTVEMSHLYGKPEVINIWASWCAPCRQEMPLLQRAHVQQGGRILFLGVDVKDSRSHALAFLADNDVSYPQVFDAHGTFPLELRLRGVPNTLFIDRSGHVVDRVIGPLTDTRLQQALAALRPD